MCSEPANFDYHMLFLLQQIAIQCPFICVQGLFYSSMFIAMHIIFKDDGVVNCIFFTYILKCVENAQESKQRRTEENNYGSWSCDEVSWLPLYCQLSGIIYFQGEVIVQSHQEFFLTGNIPMGYETNF